jgi:hypothetical protein
MLIHGRQKIKHETISLEIGAERTEAEIVALIPRIRADLDKHLKRIAE